MFHVGNLELSRRRTYCVWSLPLNFQRSGCRHNTESAVETFSEKQQEKVRLIIICKDIGEKVQSVTAKKELLKV